MWPIILVMSTVCCKSVSFENKSCGETQMKSEQVYFYVIHLLFRHKQTHYGLLKFKEPKWHYVFQSLGKISRAQTDKINLEFNYFLDCSFLEFFLEFVNSWKSIQALEFSRFFLF